MEVGTGFLGGRSRDWWWVGAIRKEDDAMIRTPCVLYTRRVF